MQEFKSFEFTKEEILPLAEKMRSEGRRLVMIQGYISKERQKVVAYQYEVGNCVESYFIKGASRLPSISQIYDMAAAWPEEELFELMGIEFEGLNLRGRLFLPDSMQEGQGHIVVTPLPELRQKALGAKEE